MSMHKVIYPTAVGYVDMDRFLRIVYNDNDLPIGNQWRHFFDGIEVIKTDKQIQNQRR